MNTTDAAQPILTAEQLEHAYGETPVLRGIDLEVRRGEVLAVMGPSGSGKSTLLHMLSGMDRPDRGQVVLEGTELTAVSDEQLAQLRLTRMGFVFQQVHLLRSLSLLDNIVLPGYAARCAPRSEVTARARQLMEVTGVGALADRAVGEASGGQLQRVGICRALINSPSILFADEPTGALDSTAGEEVMEVLMAQAALGTTIVIVTHDPRVAAHADRLVHLRDGEVTGERCAEADGQGADHEHRAAAIVQWLHQRAASHENQRDSTETLVTAI